MFLIDFLKPDWKKILVFLLPVIVSLMLLVVVPTKRPETSNIMEYLRFTVFHFPAYVEILITTKSQIINSLIFYILWYLFSCLMVWVNDSVELKGLLWRKLLKEKEVKETEHEKIVEEKKVERLNEEELKEKKKRLEEEEKRIKEEKERLHEELNRINIQKLKEMGLDIEKNKIRCVNCNKWKTFSIDKLLELIKKEGLKIIWSYECEECKG